ncbi:hypothetical protein [Mucilaginibacter conchicola]|nr:hypothetical protein [Mucilaginibacter conchicola]
MAIVMAGMLIRHKVSIHQELNLGFKGVVQKVTYSENKGTPTITVNNINYSLHNSIDFRHMIDVGDTISKEKGVVLYKLIKKGTDKVLLFND